MDNPFKIDGWINVYRCRSGEKEISYSTVLESRQLVEHIGKFAIHDWLGCVRVRSVDNETIYAETEELAKGAALPPPLAM